MSRMAGRLQPPTKEEGFSRIVVLRSKGQKSPSGAQR
jgi:hypothetical protein